jgi:putative pyruvate formate lyase activating enzyme
VFITGCNLGCVFCQNYQISRQGMGRAVDAGEFAEICLALQVRGAENINIVTGSHAVPAIVAGIARARERGLFVPVLWNSSGYEEEESLALLKDTVDVYLPDLKTLDSIMASRFFNAPEYPEYAVASILKMMEYRKLRFASGRGTAGASAEVLRSGVIIRHLVIPGCLDATREVLRWFAGKAQGRALLSLMTQYTPVKAPGPAGKSSDAPLVPSRYMSGGEYDTLVGWLEDFGIDDGFCQELVTGSEWLPEFNRKNPFSSELSVPVWHWREGFV